MAIVIQTNEKCHQISCVGIYKKQKWTKPTENTTSYRYTCDVCGHSFYRIENDKS